MANTFFKFKQFTIQQELCAMKVCTDSCLFGAMVAHYIENKKVNSILDIGTGTGLLTLMLAQKTLANIDAVEINQAACLQAKQNFESSPWKNRIHLFETSVQDFKPNKKYDFIISNPPFFENHLKSELQNKNIALHSDQLTLKELVFSVEKLLTNDGVFAVILPFERTEYFINQMPSLFLIKKINTFQTHTHKTFRSILIFSRTESVLLERNIYIKDSTNNYTTEFIKFLQDYYLYL